MVIKKIDQLRELMLSERWDEALSLASKFEDLGDHAKEIRMAHGANLSPSMYQQMGHDLQTHLRNYRNFHDEKGRKERFKKSKAKMLLNANKNDVLQ